MTSIAYQGMVIFCRDVERSAQFYEGLLGFRRERADGDVALSAPVAGTKDATIGILLHPGGAGATAGHDIGTFQVDDVDAVVGRLRSAGVPVRTEPVDEPWGVRHATVLDPDGHGVDLVGPPTSTGGPA